MGSVGAKNIQVVPRFFPRANPPKRRQDPQVQQKLGPTIVRKVANEWRPLIATLESLESSAQPWRYFQQKQAGSQKLETLSKSYFNKTCHELLDSFWRKITSTNSNISNMSWLLRKKSNMELKIHRLWTQYIKSFELIWTITQPWFCFLSSRSISVGLWH